MRLCVEARSLAHEARTTRAVLGLAARGHEVTVRGRAYGEARFIELEPSARGQEVDVLIGGDRAWSAAIAFASVRARAAVLALDPARHAGWSLADRWSWEFMRAYGVIEEAAMDHFLARTRPEERERLVLWPGPATPAADGPPSTLADTEVLERACERALARRAAGPGRAALFVDRDGTLIREREYLSDPNDVELLPGVAGALRSVRSAGHPVAVITNQAGVGRGYFTEARLWEVMARMRGLLRAEGVELDTVRVCPHAPDAGCDCRKPQGRLLREAADDLRLSLRDSAMVGDRWIDVQAGHGVGAAGVLVRTGYGAGEEQKGADGAPADAILDDVAAAARWFLDRVDAS